MGIAFSFVITPSKASEYARYIPDWYKTQNTSPEGYVRPVTRFAQMLEKTGVNYLYCAEFYDEIGLDETFPIAGIHWNKPAAYEATRELINMYEAQQGKQTRNIISNSVLVTSSPPGYANSELDIFNIVYSGLDASLGIKDTYYYAPQIRVEDDSETNRMQVLIHGGSFAGEFDHFLLSYGLVDTYKRFYYNNWSGDAACNPFTTSNSGWRVILQNLDYIIFECNEQFIPMMGTGHPGWGAADKAPIAQGQNDVYASLYAYLKSTEH